ncbi:heparan-alpha-glucosaminide N-acetyltransferase isoform X3 [Arabidopsis lyrata subsp. lyrata]|uniref:heparan-alpha-glucosaminide N-acetyltransferase isoform X3 n=1 Tax=Arabidopsis lyrata subsp. lyrata TaxID=81972 RepID=UPI000A29DABE|nr:heparan-alpha-glucosaminide N-acetyltransferase isoform X3 [Arabidopsis lyrata subsp. lyrata]|eukprot:XP_020876924.1 heparan-alpha-glucosaminide N-acetyltransferase isoform X3 [Arabidopsis lyrata subsp. lyrata]
MAEIKVERSLAGNNRQRLASLDIFRGLTVALMILVDDAGGDWPMIAHAPWNGCNLADFVMPFFLFIVGVSIALSLKRISNKFEACKKVCFRTCKLLFWGLLLQGGFSHAPDELSYGVDVTMMRIVGVSVLVIYLATLYGTYVPDWEFVVNDKDSILYGKIQSVSCGVRGKLNPPCNAVGYVDRQVLVINHMYHHPAWRRSKAFTDDSPYEGALRQDAPSWCHAPFEPEGILSSISAILSTIIGVHFGHIIIHMKGHLARLKHWISTGLVFLTLGLTLHFTHLMPLNKQLYSFSYICVTSGAAALVFSSLYSLVDVLEWKHMFLPLKWIGMNAMLVYVMGAEGILAAFFNGWYYRHPHNTLITWIREHVFIRVWHSKRVGVLMYVIFAEILFWGLVTGVFHRFKIYWKL